MSVLAAVMAPRPLASLSHSDINANRNFTTSTDSPSAEHSAPAKLNFQSQEPFDHERPGIQEDDKMNDVHDKKGMDVSEEGRGLSRQSPQKAPSKSVKEGKAPSKANMSPEQEALAADKEEKRRVRQEKKAEKAKKEAEKEAKRLKEAQRQKKSANFMSNFIVPRQSGSPVKANQHVSSEKSLSDFERTFAPCSYKDMAPTNRFGHKLDQQFEDMIGQNQHSHENLLQIFLGERNVTHTKQRPRKGVHAPISVRETMRLITEAGVTGDERLEENGRKGMADLANRKRVAVKLLHFSTDRRPAWYGTWTRSSNLVGARKPLGQDPVAIDYSLDSDAEWEEFDPADGDDVHDNDNDEDDRNSRSDSDSEMDDWLVDDLEEEEEDQAEHPALRLADPFDIDDPLSGPSRRSTTSHAEPAKKKRKIKPIGRRFESKLVKFATGPHWETCIGRPSYDGFRPYQMEMLNDALPGLNPFTFASDEKTFVSASSMALAATVKLQSIPGEPEWNMSSATQGGQASDEVKGPNTAASSSNGHAPSSAVITKAQTFPSEHLSRLLRHIEGSTSLLRPILLEELRGAFCDVGRKGVPKSTLDACLTLYAEKQSKVAGGKWVIRQQYRHLAQFV